jgi:hypothetical protein
MEDSEFIDLGDKVEMPEIAPAEANERIHYPSLYFSGKDSLKGLPKEGTAIIKYKKVMEREETMKRDGDEKTRYTTELEIHAIKAGEASESAAEEANEPSNEDAIEKGLEAASTSTSKEK